MSTVDDTENISTNLVFLKMTLRQHLLIFCQYLTSGVIRGLYECQRITPDATRSFLVDITASRVVFSATLVPRDPCDNSEMCVHTRSLVTRLLIQTGF